MIVVIDASVFTSAAIKPGSVSDQALGRALAPDHILCLSRAVEGEYRDVLFRRKFDAYVSDERRDLVLRAVQDTAKRIEPAERILDCADAKDNCYLELALAGGAFAIVTGDRRHLLAMGPLAWHPAHQPRRVPGDAGELTLTRIPAPHIGTHANPL